MFAIIDIESTGGAFNQEGIIEIAILRFDGHEVVDRFISLVRPDRPIQNYVTRLTGISEKMVRKAPGFHEIAKRIVEITEDAIIVAHNAPFDYRMLQLEFNRLGYKYQRKTIDTIGLAEMLIPGLNGYGLEKVCDALGIDNTKRHRAEGDTLATLELFKHLMHRDEEKLISKIARSHKSGEVDHKFNHLTAPLENVTGMYFLYNSQGEVVFAGRSNDLRNKINRHFLPTSKKAKELQDEIDSLEIEKTGSELLARVKEIVAIEKLQPKYYRNQRPFLEFGLNVVEKKGEVQGIKIVQLNKRSHAQAYFATKQDAITFARKLSAILGLDPNKYVEGKPDADEVLPEKRYKNWRMALKRLMLPGRSVLLIDKGRSPMEKSFLYIHNSRVSGHGFYELESQVEDLEKIKNRMVSMRDNSYIRSVVYHFLSHKKGLQIKPLPKD